MCILSAAPVSVRTHPSDRLTYLVLYISSILATLVLCHVVALVIVASRTFSAAIGSPLSRTSSTALTQTNPSKYEPPCASLSARVA
ncbi:uncharacterized protein PHACADRAFT_160426 [Phanerochaete carnosa HHB-10118-sp]|uniref:Uncharacterized protein n=1 Tax=Phanerochaete carnosa (strain HHB-10118-sp) TaxID=650164 RepID=K5VZ98_PHACS|nr:uncharacterized protein PHACADRAFT_160426 [Phanerochaete carnosa HHB-10118-sp]EKM56888.1 hypothetical protein PHACADRAFT_160426 [Phanerochaete carnosa HHB-10118-sp]